MQLAARDTRDALAATRPAGYPPPMGFHATEPLDPGPESRGTEISMAPFSITTSGHRYYGPALGRWLSRDPIAERGGRHLYRFCYNDPVRNWDNRGLDVNVVHTPPDPTKIVPTFVEFSDVSVGLPWEKVDPSLVGGQTTYPYKEISCSCACPDPKAKGKKWFLSCTVSWSAEIRLNKNWPADKLSGAYGHEQRHVKSRTLIVQQRVVDPLSKRDGQFASENRCADVAKDYERFYFLELKAALDDTKDNHKGGESGYVNDESPGRHDLIDPLPGSPEITPPGK